MLGDIDRSTLAAQERIRDEVDSVDEDLVRSRIILVVTVVVASVLLMLLALMLVIRIVAPLVQLQEEMARVAVMNLSQVDETRAISNIEEVGHMQTSFLQMLRNLKEYRNYMPASVLVEDMTESGTNDSSKDVTDLTFSRTSDCSSLSRSLVAQPFLAMQKLDQKKVAFSVVNVRSFFEASRELPSREMQAHHTEYLSTVLCITHEFSGVNDGFSGDRVMTHWNGARHCTSPKLQAAKFSHKVHTDKTLQAQKWTLSMAFVCAEVRCGNMGCQGMKKYTFLGGCVPWLHALERLNKTYGTTILHDNVTHSSVANAFYSRTVACVSYPKFRDTLVLSELCEEMQTEDEEWMYQLDRCLAANPFNDHNTAMAHIFAAQWDDAVAEAKKLGDADRAEVERHCTAAREVCEKEYRLERLLAVSSL